MFCKTCGYNLFGSDECNRCTGLVPSHCFKTRTVQLPVAKCDLLAEVMDLLDPGQTAKIVFHNAAFDRSAACPGFYIIDFGREEWFDPHDFGADFKYLVPVNATL